MRIVAIVDSCESGFTFSLVTSPCPMVPIPFCDWMKLPVSEAGLGSQSCHWRDASWIDSVRNPVSNMLRSLMFLTGEEEFDQENREWNKTNGILSPNSQGPFPLQMSTWVAPISPLFTRSHRFILIVWWYMFISIYPVSNYRLTHLCFEILDKLNGSGFHHDI